MHEKRLTTRLTDHWNALPRTEGKDAPEYKHFRAPQINDVIPLCAKIRIQDPESPSPLCGFEEAGEKLQEAFGKDALVGKLLRPNAPIYPAARIIRNIPIIIKNTQPIEDDGQFTNEAGKLVKYRSILLPFAEHKSIVEVVIIGFNWRVFG